MKMMTTEQGPRPQDQDTICATITPYGVGAVSMVRVSGSKAVTTIQKICPFLPKDLKSHQAYLGFMSYQNENIDEVVVLFFEKGRSFTSEETIEICCHGNPVICEEILNILQDLGCRMAEKGEFTYRAFLSGRIDLIQAEGVLSLIEARSSQSKKQSLRYLKGNFSNQIENLQKTAQSILANVEAGIDFTEENLNLLSHQKLLEEVEDLNKKSLSLIQNYKQGVRVQKGLKVGLFGPPNSGKSTIFNSLLKEEKAIVSDQEGTTRDQLDGEFFLKGQRICLMDTAGLRKTEGLIEKKGLEKTYQTLGLADVCLFVLDISSPFFEKEFKNIFSKKEGEKDCNQRFYQDFLNRKKSFPEEILFVFNKVDLVSKKSFLSSLEEKNPVLYKEVKKEKILFISAQKGEGLNELKEIFVKLFQQGQESISLPRHYQHLFQASEHSQKALDLIKRQSLEEIPFELVAFEIRAFLQNTERLLGQEVSFDVLNDIFQNFCIGK